jgi:lysylphosphatidylglycerol synthetase-like protein (DUF2156 family)
LRLLDRFVFPPTVPVARDRAEYALLVKRMRLPAAERLLGAAAATVGLIGIASALTPSIAARSEFVQGLLPPGFPAAARLLTLAFGFALVWLSRALARRARIHI